MEAEKSYKLNDVSAELHQKHTDILEFLRKKGYEIPKKPPQAMLTWKLQEEMYQACVQEFDRARWAKMQEGLHRAEEERHRLDLERKRHEEMVLRELNLKQSIHEVVLEVTVEVPKTTPSKEAVKEPVAEPVIAVPPVEPEPVPVTEPPTEPVIAEPEIVEPEPAIPAPEEPVAAAPVPEPVAEVKAIPEVEAVAEIEPEVETVEEKEAEKEHIPLPAYKGLVIVSVGEKKKHKKPETPPTSLVKGKVGKEKEREQRKKEKPSAPPASHVTKKPATKEPEAPVKAAEPVVEKGVEGEKKWKRLSKLTKAEADELVRVKSKALKERVVPAALPEVAKGRRPRPKKVDVQAVESQLRQTLAAISEGRRSKKRHKRVIRDDGVEIETNVLRLTEFVTTAELANLLEIEPSELIKKCIGMGMLVTLNQRMDKDTIVLLAAEYGTEVEFITDEDEEEEEVEEVEGELKPRQPVVTVMGHVDHGKTTLLDYLRKTNVAGGEHGGITQHIGAYEVTIRDQKITFLDTPGHEAFTAMRARGAQITDIVVLVVAADDQVMPQTLEAIDHARAANVPIVIAINKIDKPNAAPETIKRQLADRGILIEEWGGKYQSAEISAKKGLNIEKLLDEILIAAEIAEIKAVYEGEARGVVLESRLDKGRGTIATVLVQRGTLRIGDAFVAGQQFGRVRMLLNEIGERREAAFPGTPVQVVGLTGIPQAGDRFLVYATEREAKEIATRRTQQQREQQFRQVKLMTLEQFSKQQAIGGGFGELNCIIKGDADGSVEVLADSLMKLSGTELKVNVIHKSVGAITESDVLLAAASRAIVIGFHVHPNPNAREVAAREKVDIRLYKVIYNVVDDVRAALQGMLRPDYKEIVKATVEVRDTFKISKVGTVAGCFVQGGLITRNSKIRLLRDGKEVWNGSLNSLQRFKDSVREVKEGFECGIVLEGFNDIKVGDIIEAYDTVAEARQLSEQLVM